MATSSTYCTHRDLKDIYPNIDAFDSKTPIYGWLLSTAGTNFMSSTLDIYYAANTGLITELFFDGSKCAKIAYNTTHTTLAYGLTSVGTALGVDDVSAITANDLVKMDDEYMLVTSVDAGTDPDTLNVTRGIAGTTNYGHADDTKIYIIFESGLNIISPTSDSDVPRFIYDPDLDLCIMIIDSKDPNDYLVEAGEDYSTLITRITKNASRYFDSRVDATLPRDQWKDKEGNYDYLIVRTVALMSAAFLLKSQDPLNPMIDSFEEEYNMNLGLLNGGQARLSHQNTSDSSKGIIREVDAARDGDIRPVDTRGSWGGTYDLIKVKIILGGETGTATYSVWVKDGDKLGVNEGSQVVTAETINGDYQTLAGGLQIRFAGENKTSVATADDEWEIEVFGRGEMIDNPVVRSVKMTRAYNPNRYR